MSDLQVLDELGRRLEAGSVRRRAPHRRWTLALVVAAGLAILVAGAAVGSAILRDRTPPERTSVSLLNATTTPGRAGRLAPAIARSGFRLGTVSNYPRFLRESRVEYGPGHRGAALRVARLLGISRVGPMTAEETAVVEAAACGRVDVAVILGRDRPR
jgi:hypothetical protein